MLRQLVGDELADASNPTGVLVRALVDTGGRPVTMVDGVCGLPAVLVTNAGNSDVVPVDRVELCATVRRVSSPLIERVRHLTGSCCKHWC